MMNKDREEQIIKFLDRWIEERADISFHRKIHKKIRREGGEVSSDFILFMDDCEKLVHEKFLSEFEEERKLGEKIRLYANDLGFEVGILINKPKFDKEVLLPVESEPAQVEVEQLPKILPIIAKQEELIFTFSPEEIKEAHSGSRNFYVPELKEHHSERRKFYVSELTDLGFGKEKIKEFLVYDKRRLSTLEKIEGLNLKFDELLSLSGEEELAFIDDKLDSKNNMDLDILGQFKEMGLRNYRSLRDKIEEIAKEKNNLILLNEKYKDFFKNNAVVAPHEDFKLLEEQVEDADKIEKRLSKNAGIILSSEVGTGKTFVCLESVKRFCEKNANSDLKVLIVCKGPLHIIGWKEEANKIGLKINFIKFENSPVFGQVQMSTYSVMAKNPDIYNSVYDFVVFDECHRLNSGNNYPDNETALAYKKICNISFYISDEDSTPFDKRKFDHKDILRKNNLSLFFIDKCLGKFSIKDSGNSVISWSEDSEFKKLINRKLSEEDVKKVPKVILASATPFSYAKNVFYANPLLDAKSETILLQELGYYQSYNKWVALKDHEKGIYERKFADNLMASGAMIKRYSVVDVDYGRYFVNCHRGKEYNEAVNRLMMLYNGNNSQGQKFIPDRHKNKFSAKKLNINFDFAQRVSYFTKVPEAFEKAKEVVKIGKNVIIFYAYKNPNFECPVENFLTVYKEKVIDDKYNSLDDHIKNILKIDGFEGEISEFIDLKKKLDLSFSIDSVCDGKNIMNLNGGTSAKNVKKYMETFQKESGKILFLQGEKGKEGISLHDLKGDTPRISIDTTLINKPTDSIQREGRTNRIGCKSNPSYFYMVNSGSFLDEIYFMNKSAGRSGTVANLSSGSLGLDQEKILRTGFMERMDFNFRNLSSSGGKAKDKGITRFQFDSSKDRPLDWVLNNEVSGKFEQKKAKNLNNYLDLYPTPTSLGFILAGGLKLEKKLQNNVENGRNDGKVKILEPSAGYGNLILVLAKSSNVNLTLIECQYEPYSEILSKYGNHKVVCEDFKKFDLTNKFDAIIMNPPFGRAGVKFNDHLNKAFSHISKDGSIVAIGPSSHKVDRKVLEMRNYTNDNKKGQYYTEQFIEVDQRFDLPAWVFKEAGTNVNCSVYVIHMVDDNKVKEMDIIDLRGKENLKELCYGIEECFDAPKIFETVVVNSKEPKNFKEEELSCEPEFEM